MQKTFKQYKNIIIVLAILSLVIPYVPAIVLIIYVIYKSKVFLNILYKIEEADVDTYINNKYQEANTNYNNIIENANIESNRILEKMQQEYTQQIDSYESKLNVLNEEYEKTKVELTNYLNELNSKVFFIESDFIIDENITSEEFKNKALIIKTKLEALIKSNHAFEDASLYKNSTSYALERILLRCFQSESKNIIDSVNIRNIDTQRARLNKLFYAINKLSDKVKLSINVFELKLEELNLYYAYVLKKEQEREEQKAIREQMLEEEKVRREIEHEKAKIEKEEHQFKNEISKLMKYLHKASDIEKQLYLDKIKELEEKLNLLQKDKNNVLEREQNTRAGFVYIISNIGSFGENIYKIGMTRRLEPMDRVKELGSASVPFEFDVHAMIFSEDAPRLETILHNTFKNKQVNKVNPRKEFFNVSLSEIEKVIKENHNATVHFTEIAKAEQYRQSLRLINAMPEVI